MLRRSFLAGAGAAAATASLPRPARAQETARRVFRILRAGDDIGRHVLDARLGPDGFVIDIDIDIRVKLLGFTAYRYELTNRETWSGGHIVQVDSRVNDDGDEAYARIMRAGDRLEVDGSGYAGPAPFSSVTTSYFTPAFLDRRPWISTQSGKRLSVETRPAGSSRWQVSGELETQLVYEGGEWMGSIFDAGGETARYETLESTGSISDLWSRA